MNVNAEAQSFLDDQNLPKAVDHLWGSHIFTTLKGCDPLNLPCGASTRIIPFLGRVGQGQKRSPILSPTSIQYTIKLCRNYVTSEFNIFMNVNAEAQSFLDVQNLPKAVDDLWGSHIFTTLKGCDPLNLPCGASTRIIPYPISPRSGFPFTTLVTPSVFSFLENHFHRHLPSSS